MKSVPPPESPDSSQRPTVAVREASADMASILAEIDAAMARSAAAEQAEAAARPAMIKVDREEAASEPAPEPVRDVMKEEEPPPAPEPVRAHDVSAEARSRLNWFIGVADTTSQDPGSLTYEPYFGLREKPFSLSSDPRFFFSHASHGAAFDTLAAGIRRREGLLVLTGEVGTGKTTLCRAVLQSLDQQTFAAFVPDPFLSREDLLKTLLVDFGVVSVDEIRSGRLRGASRTDLSYPLYEFLTSLQPLKAFAVVMIDEAQNLSPELLEEVRVLSDLDNGQKLLEVVLVGQPELKARMATTALRQVNQRVSVRCELLPLVRDDVARYIAHRLAVAGSDGSVQFAPAAVELVWAASNGIPRLINLVCDRALQRAARARTIRVDVEHVLWAVDDLNLATAPRVMDAPEVVEAPVAASVRAPEPAPVPRREQAQEVAAAPAPSADDPTDPFTLFLRESWRASAEREEQAQPAQRELPPVAVPVVSSPIVLKRGGRLSSIDLSSRPTEGPVDEGRLRELPEPVGKEPFTAELPRGRTWLVPAGVCVALLAGLGGYWYSVARPSGRRPAAAAAAVVQQTAQPQPPVVQEPAPAVPEPTPSAAAVPAAPKFAIRMATFQSSARTGLALQEFRDAGFKAYSVEATLSDGGRAFGVFLGPYSDRAEVELARSRAMEVPGYGGGFIVQISSAVPGQKAQ